MNEQICTCDWTLDLTENPCPTHGTERCLREVNGPTIEQMIEEMCAKAQTLEVYIHNGQWAAIYHLDDTTEMGAPGDSLGTAVRALYEKYNVWIKNAPGSE